MSDRELLELAAKAAGMNLYVWGTKGSESIADTDAKPHSKLWNPLTDDGDALRLAVKLYMLVDVMGSGETETLGGFSSVMYGSVSESHGNDPFAATRRAIVRAAAEIGKATP